MTFNQLPKDSLSNLDPVTIENYVEVTGWQRVMGVPASVALFQRDIPGSKDDVQEIVIPRDRNFADFSERMADVIATLGAAENRTSVEVLNSLLKPSDILRFRVVSPETTNGVLPFLEGVDLYNGMKHAFLSAACDLIKPQSYHPRLIRQEASRYLQNCQLGQSMVGSYIATVICPIDTPLNNKQANVSVNQGTLFPILPRSEFNRGVTARVMQACQIIRTRLDKGDVDYLVNPSDTNDIISGNFFDALVEMQADQPESSLTISCSWSSTLAMTRDIPDTVMVPEDYFVEIEQIGNRLRPEFTPEPREIIGKVFSLAGEENESSLMEGEIYIRFINGDLLSDTKVALEPEDYEKACDAHKEGRYVRLFGILDKHHRRYVITEPRYFEILPFTTFGSGIKLQYAKQAQKKLKRIRPKGL